MNKFQINMNQHNHYLTFPQASSVGENVTNNANAPNLNNFMLPFPPTIRASDIAQKRLRSRICSKSPNAFFIYRKAFVEQLSIFNGNNKLKMTEVSRLVSLHWKEESELVKGAYEDIAKQVEQELNEIRNKDLVYTDDFDTGNRRRRKNKNHKRSRRSNSEFGSDAFFMSLKGNANFNISTLDFSVKPKNANFNISTLDFSVKDNSNPPSLSSSPSQSVSSEGFVNYEESSSSDDSSIPDATITTFDNDYNDVDNIQQLQQNNFEFTSPISEEVGFDIICDSNLLTPISPPICDLYNYQYPQNEHEFNLIESFLNNNNDDDENSSTSSSSLASFFHPDHELNSYGFMGCFDNLS